MIHVAVVIVVLAGVAHADPMSPEARAHLERGTAAYQAGDYALAISELEAGVAIDADPAFLYALGQAYRKNGDCAHAVERYLAFLATHPPEADAAHARANITACPTPKHEEPVAPPAPPSPPPPPPVVVHRDPPRPPPERAPFYRDVPGDLLAGGGLVGLGAGVTYFVLGERDASAANSAPTLAKLQQLSAASDRERTIGTFATIAGGALAVGAVVRYVMVAREPAVSLHVTSTSASAVWSGRF